MKTLKIAAGTISDQKIGYLKEVLSEIGADAEIIPIDVESGISEQPITEEETQTGSMNRAKSAFEKVDNADFGIGIEVGYHKNAKEDYEMFCCASIFGKGEKVASCLSTRFLLPDFHQEILKEGKYLGEYVREYKKDIDEPVVNYIRELVRGRKPLVIEAVRNVLLQFLELHATVSNLLASDSLDYRKKVAAVVLNKKKQVLLLQLVVYRNDDWNIPGGGIEGGETPEEAVIRELSEELGTNKFEILKKISFENQYEWPEHVIVDGFKKKKFNRGQIQTQFVVKFTGNDSDIKIQEEEVRRYKWVAKKDLADYLHFEGQLDNVLKILDEYGKQN